MSVCAYVYIYVYNLKILVIHPPLYINICMRSISDSNVCECECVYVCMYSHDSVDSSTTVI